MMLVMMTVTQDLATLQKLPVIVDRMWSVTRWISTDWHHGMWALCIRRWRL